MPVCYYIIGKPQLRRKNKLISVVVCRLHGQKSKCRVTQSAVGNLLRPSRPTAGFEIVLLSCCSDPKVQPAFSQHFRVFTAGGVQQM